MSFSVASCGLEVLVQTCFELKANAFIVEVGRGSPEGDIEGLKRGSPIFKTLFLWEKSGTEDLRAYTLLPIVRKPTSSKFFHELFEAKSGESFSVNGDPVVNEVVFETTEYAGNFEIIINSSESLGVDKVIKTVIFKIFDSLGRNVTV